MRRYAYAWAPLAFFVVSFGLHWLLGWSAVVDDGRDHGGPANLSPSLVWMGRNTFENGRSDFLQLLWQVVGLPCFPYVGSPAARENGDRPEARFDALLQHVRKARGEALIREIDATQEARGGHARVHNEPPYHG